MRAIATFAKARPKIDNVRYNLKLNIQNRKEDILNLDAITRT